MLIINILILRIATIKHYHKTILERQHLHRYRTRAIITVVCITKNV